MEWLTKHSQDDKLFQLKHGFSDTNIIHTALSEPDGRHHHSSNFSHHMTAVMSTSPSGAPQSHVHSRTGAASARGA